MPQQQSYRPIGELAKDGDLVFAPESLSHRFGRVVEVTTTHVTYRSIPSDREISIPAHWPVFWNVTDRTAVWSCRQAIAACGNVP